MLGPGARSCLALATAALAFLTLLSNANGTRDPHMAAIARRVAAEEIMCDFGGDLCYQFGRRCNNATGKPVCVTGKDGCTFGFALADPLLPNGNCTEVNECIGDIDCSNKHRECLDMIGYAECGECLPRWTAPVKPDNRTLVCVDLDECSNSTLNICEGQKPEKICHNFENGEGYECTEWCEAGWFRWKGTCVKGIDFCKTGEDNCGDYDNARCVYEPEANYWTCKCNEGFLGDPYTGDSNPEAGTGCFCPQPLDNDKSTLPTWRALEVVEGQCQCPYLWEGYKGYSYDGERTTVCVECNDDGGCGENAKCVNYQCVCGAQGVSQFPFVDPDTNDANDGGCVACTGGSGRRSRALLNGNTCFNFNDCRCVSNECQCEGGLVPDSSTEVYGGNLMGCVQCVSHIDCAAYYQEGGQASGETNVGGTGEWSFYPDRTMRLGFCAADNTCQCAAGYQRNGGTGNLMLCVPIAPTPK